MAQLMRVSFTLTNYLKARNRTLILVTCLFLISNVSTTFVRNDKLQHDNEMSHTKDTTNIQQRMKNIQHTFPNVEHHTRGEDLLKEKPVTAAAQQKTLRRLWERFERERDSPRAVPQQHHRQDGRTPLSEPECGSMQHLTSSQRSYAITLQPTEGTRCSYTITTPHGASATLTCADVMDKGRVRGKQCRGSLRVTQGRYHSTVDCGRRRLMSLRHRRRRRPGTPQRSQLIYIQCALALDDTEESDETTVAPPPSGQLCPKECGLRTGNFEDRRRVVGGMQALPGEFPWQALIVTMRSNKELAMCGGSVISPHYVLSAAHCFKVDTWWAVGGTFVALGVHNISEALDDPMVQITSVLRIIVHPEYNFQEISADMALVQLSQAVVWSPRVSPVCLAAPDTAQAGNIVTVSGFGVAKYRIHHYSNGTTGTDIVMPTVLRKAQLEVMEQWVCQLLFMMHGIDVPDTQLCTKGFHEDSCQGDSGGPVVLQDDKARFIQVGIVSYGVSCGNIIYPSVNTRVSSYSNWVFATVGTDVC